MKVTVEDGRLTAIEPVTANAFATLNQIAPGRIDFGVGTGFTGRRTMGLGPISLARMEGVPGWLIVVSRIEVGAAVHGIG